MTAIREQIVLAFETRLRGIAGIVEFERMGSSAPSTFPALGLDDRGQYRIDGETQRNHWVMTLAVEGFVQGANAPSAMNALYADVVRAVMADPPQLGGLAESIDEGSLSIEVAALANKRTIAFTLIFEIEFTAGIIDPAAS